MGNNSEDPQNKKRSDQKSFENSLTSNRTSKTMKMATEPASNYEDYKSRKYRNYPKKMEDNNSNLVNLLSEENKNLKHNENEDNMNIKMGNNNEQRNRNQMNIKMGNINDNEQIRNNQNIVMGNQNRNYNENEQIKNNIIFPKSKMSNNPENIESNRNNNIVMGNAYRNDNYDRNKAMNLRDNLIRMNEKNFKPNQNYNNNSYRNTASNQYDNSGNTSGQYGSAVFGSSNTSYNQYNQKIKGNNNINEYGINMGDAFAERSIGMNNRTNNINYGNSNSYNNNSKEILDDLYNNNFSGNPRDLKDKYIAMRFLTKGVNKYSLGYFSYLVKDYMMKLAFLQCIDNIYRYEIFREKKYGIKILFRLMKKRIIFYKIKFFHRYHKIYKFLLKHKK
jgi:hypothetical protein